MLYRPAAQANRSRTHSTGFLPFILSAILLSSVSWLTGCSGFSTPAAATGNTVTAASSDSLTISGSLPTATVGSSYKAALTVSGGTAPYDFVVASGQLPAGLLLGATTGSLSGTPAAAGTFSFAIKVSDSDGASKQQSFQLSVLSLSNSGGGSSGGNGGTGGGSGGGTGGSGTGTGTGTPMNSFSNLQQSAGWADYGQGPPNFIDCSPSPCDGITFSMQQGISSPSLSGSSTEFNLGGTAVYTDALFNNHLIGALSSQGMPDNNHTLVPTYHSFTYDVYFYGTNLELSQAVEFDINQFFDGTGFIWGHECRIAGGNEWDVWNNVTGDWTPTAIPCYPVDNTWNHVTIQVQRTAGNQLLYESITLNGVTSILNQHYDPGAAPSNWYGITINYQMDGNYEQSPYSVYLDELTFSYE
jgi:hypothetical protein